MKKPKPMPLKPPEPAPGSIDRWATDGGTIPGVLPVHHEQITADPPKRPSKEQR